MKTFIFALALVIYSAGVACSYLLKYKIDNPPNHHYTQTSESVKPDNNPILATWAGSATAVSNDGYYITAAHVVKGALLILVSDSVHGIKHAATVVAVDYEHDVAVIKSEPLTRYFIQYLDDTKIADKAISCGFSLLRVFNTCSYTEGRIVNVDDEKAFNSSPINHGDSGSGVINDQGELVGVVSGMMVDAMGVPTPKSGVFIPSTQIRKILSSIGIYLPRSSGHILSQDALTALISKSSIFVSVIGFNEGD